MLAGTPRVNGTDSGCTDDNGVDCEPGLFESVNPISRTGRSTSEKERTVQDGENMGWQQVGIVWDPTGRDAADIWGGRV